VTAAAPQRAAGARPRLLLLSPLPPPTGGIPTWTLGVLGSSLRERYEIRVVNTSPPEKTSVHGKSRLRPDRAFDALRILGQLIAGLVRFRPHVVHVNTPYYWAFVRDGLAVWIARALGARTVLHFRGGDFAEFARSRPRPLRALIERTLRRSDRLIALTAATEDYLRAAAGGERVRRIPNFVRLEDLGPPPDRSGRGGPVEVLFVGWLLEAKGVRELLRAARVVRGARFTLVGPEQPSFVATLGEELAAVGDRVRLLPPRPREEIVALYREADVFVLPTWREGFPNVVLEAMAAGLPVVATPVGAIADAVRDGSDGLLVPPRDAEALARALGRLVADPELRRAMGARARARVESMFSLEAVVARLEGVYRELLPEGVR
jgi:glycosyltransferase involved in cell wall biosynthesis